MSDVEKIEHQLRAALAAVVGFKVASERGAVESANALLERARKETEKAHNLLKKMEA